MFWVEDKRGKVYVAYPKPGCPGVYVVDGIEYDEAEFWKLFRQVTK